MVRIILIHLLYCVRQCLTHRLCPCSFVKVGAMVFLCHDINDIFMEGAKMARYAENRRALPLCNLVGLRKPGSRTKSVQATACIVMRAGNPFPS